MADTNGISAGAMSDDGNNSQDELPAARPSLVFGIDAPNEMRANNKRNSFDGGGDDDDEEEEEEDDIEDMMDDGEKWDEEENDQSLDSKQPDDDEVLERPTKRMRPNPSDEVKPLKKRAVSSAAAVDNYSEQVLQMMHTFLSDALFCDISLVATKGHKVFMAHRVVLAAASSHLRVLLTGEIERVMIDLSDDAAECLRTYLYVGHVQLGQNLAQELLPIAQEWLLDSLVTLCEEAGAHISLTATSSAPSEEVSLYELSEMESANRTWKRPSGMKGESESEATDPILGQSNRSSSGRILSSDDVDQDDTNNLLGLHLRTLSDDDDVSHDKQILASGESDDGSGTLGSIHLLPPDGVKEEPDDQNDVYGLMPASISLPADADSTEDGFAAIKIEPEHDGSLSDIPRQSPPVNSIPEGSDSGCLYRCYICKLMFADMQACVAHLSSVHKADKNLMMSATALPSTSSAASSQGAAQAANSSKAVLYQCTTCKKQFADVAACQSHIMNDHNHAVTPPVVGKPPEPYHCYICQRTFPDAIAGRTHSLKAHCHRMKENNAGESSQAASSSPAVTPPVSREKRSAKSSMANSSGASAEMEDCIDPSQYKDTEFPEFPFPNYPFQCNFCKLLFTNAMVCQTHIHEQHSISLDMVHVCFTRRKNRYKGKVAGRAQAGQNAGSSGRAAQPSVTIPLVCGIDGCGHRVRKVLDMAYHHYLRHNIPLPTWTTTYLCPICNRTCTTKAALSNHLSKTHADSPELLNLLSNKPQPP